MVFEGEKVLLLMVLFVCFVFLVLEEYFVFVLCLIESGDVLIFFDGVNFGIVVDIEWGFFVLVFFYVYMFSVGEFDVVLWEFIVMVRVGLMFFEWLCGLMFIFNNYGGFGVDGLVVIINYFDVVILGIGWIFEWLWVVDGVIVFWWIM